MVVNHGTGVPDAAVRLAELCAPRGVAVLDAPVSGGRPGAEEKRLITMVGGEPQALRRCAPVFDAFSARVVHLGGPGAGQTAKLFNNALLMLNQAAVGEVVGLADRLGLDLGPLVEVLRLGSGSSAALHLLGPMVRGDNVAHLSGVEALDMELFDRALKDAGVDPGPVTARGLAGAHGLPALVARLER